MVVAVQSVPSEVLYSINFLSTPQLLVLLTCPDTCQNWVDFGIYFSSDKHWYSLRSLKNCMNFGIFNICLQALELLNIQFYLYCGWISDITSTSYISWNKEELDGFLYVESELLWKNFGFYIDTYCGDSYCEHRNGMNEFTPVHKFSKVGWI